MSYCMNVCCHMLWGYASRSQPSLASAPAGAAWRGWVQRHSYLCPCLSKCLGGEEGDSPTSAPSKHRATTVQSLQTVQDYHTVFVLVVILSGHQVIPPVRTASRSLFRSVCPEQSYCHSQFSHSLSSCLFLVIQVAVPWTLRSLRTVSIQKFWTQRTLSLTTDFHCCCHLPGTLSGLVHLPLHSTPCSVRFTTAP